MKHLFDAPVRDEVQARLARLRPNAERQWGRMTVDQMVAHCGNSIEMALGERLPPRAFIGRLLGRMIKPLALGDDAPMRRNAPTSAAIAVADTRDFAAERERLRELIDRFVAAGPAGVTTHPHPFFGRLTPEEWSVLMYKHLDHHLRQFGA